VPELYLQFDAIGVLENGFDDSILNLPVVQVHANAFPDFDLRSGWFGLLGTRRFYTTRFLYMRETETGNGRVAI